MLNRSEMLDKPFHCMNKDLGSRPLCGLMCIRGEAPGTVTPSVPPSAEECHCPKPSSSISTSRFKKTFGEKTKTMNWAFDVEMWQLSRCHLHSCMRVKEWTGGGWCYLSSLDSEMSKTLFKDISLLRGQADCAFEASLCVLVGQLNPQFLFPYSLTTSPSSNTTWHSKGFTEPTATPLS